MSREVTDRRWIDAVVREAERHREDIANGEGDAMTLTTDAQMEAESAWRGTGLVDESYTDAEIREVCRNVVDQVAASMVLGGWTPPSWLPTPGSSADRTGFGEIVRPEPAASSSAGVSREATP